MLLRVLHQGSIIGESTDQLRRKFCENCDSWCGGSFYYDHICEKSSLKRLNVKGELSKNEVDLSEHSSTIVEIPEKFSSVLIVF